MLLTLRRNQQLQKNQGGFVHIIIDLLLMGEWVEGGGHLLKLSQHRGEHFSQLVHGGVAIAGHTHTHTHVWTFILIRNPELCSRINKLSLVNELPKLFTFQMN